MTEERTSIVDKQNSKDEEESNIIKIDEFLRKKNISDKTNIISQKIADQMNFPVQNFQVTEEPIKRREHELSPEDAEKILKTLKQRFEINMYLHKDIEWTKVEGALKKDSEALWSVHQMEIAGHEPDVYDWNSESFDIGTCSKEVPVSSVNCVYDKGISEFSEYLLKGNCNGGAVQMAEAMGINIMSWMQYCGNLQTKGNFDERTWTWFLVKEYLKNTGLVERASRSKDLNKIITKTETANYTHYNDCGWRGTRKVFWAA